MGDCTDCARRALVGREAYRPLALFFLAAGACLAADRAVAHDPATLGLDVARRAWLAYHPLGKVGAANATIVDIRQEDRLAKVVVRIGWPGTRRGLQRDPGPREAEVCAMFLFRPAQARLIDLEYHEKHAGWTPKRDHTAEIIANYNIRLERKDYSPFAATLEAGYDGTPDNDDRGFELLRLGGKHGPFGRWKTPSLVSELRGRLTDFATTSRGLNAGDDNDACYRQPLIEIEDNDCAEACSASGAPPQTDQATELQYPME